MILKQFNNSLKLKVGASFFIVLISSSSTAELSKTIFSSSLVYDSHAITVKRDKRASDNFNSSPVLRVAITLKSTLKFLILYFLLLLMWNIFY